MKSGARGPIFPDGASMKGRNGEREAPGHIAVAIALVAPFLAAAAIGGWRNGLAIGDANGYDGYIAASYVWREVARSFALALALGVPCALVAAWFRSGGRRVAGILVLLGAVQAAWLVPVLEAPESWAVARVREGFAVPNLFWRVRHLGLASDAVWPALAILLAGLVLAVVVARGGLRFRASALRRVSLFLLAVAAVALVAAWGLMESARPSDTGRPVLFLTWDSTRADHLSCYGYERETTPAVDALAKDAVLYERAYSNHNWTRPSYMSTLAGVPGWEVDIRRLRTSRTLLAESLKAAGYATRAFVQNPNLDFSFRMDQGIDRYLQFVEDARPAEIAEWAKAAIDELAGGPFFLFVHIEQPHWPYLRDGEYVRGKFDPANPPVSTGLVEELLAYHRVEKWEAERADTPERLQFLLDLYDGDIKDADDAVGEILDHLKAHGLYDESLIVFFSDHGDEFFDRGNFGHAHPNVHQDVTRVPMVVRFPASFGVAPHRSEVPVQNLDLFPTVVDVLGLQPVSGLRGTSLLALERAVPDRTILSTYDGLIAVRTRDVALFRDFKRERGPVLYDVSEDPGERELVLDPEAHPEYDELVALAEWWSRECWPDAVDVTGAGDVSPELAERLRELGYLGE